MIMQVLSLYHITEELTSLLANGIDPDTGEMSLELGEALSKFDHKGTAVAAHILNLEATASATDEVIKRLERRAQSLKKSALTLRSYLQANMKKTGIPSISSDDGSFQVKLSIGVDKSVDILDQKKIPAAHMSKPVMPEPMPDKRAIKAALKEGKDVPGARIVANDRLTIG